MSSKLKSRPSEILGIDEYPAAFFLDRAITTFGAHLEGEIAKVDEEKKKSAAAKRMRKQMILARYLGEQPKFRDPGGAANA